MNRKIIRLKKKIQNNAKLIYVSFLTGSLATRSSSTSWARSRRRWSAPGTDRCEDSAAERSTMRSCTSPSRESPLLSRRWENCGFEPPSHPAPGRGSGTAPIRGPSPCRSTSSSALSKAARIACT